MVEATGRSGKVSLVAANGWCQVTYDDEECEGQTETLQCPDLVREEAALAETIDAEVSDFDEVLIKWGFKEDPRIPEECARVSNRAVPEGFFRIRQVPCRPDDPQINADRRASYSVHKSKFHGGVCWIVASTHIDATPTPCTQLTG